ncbi:MAG: heme-binding protein [Arenicellales bacterium]
MQVVEYGLPIQLAAAKRVIEAAEKEAAANGWAMVIAIVDSTGHLVALYKMDHAQYGSVEIAQAKARTAVNLKRPTKVLQDGVAEGGIGLRMLSVEGLSALEGGVLLMDEDRIVGGIGVSGADSTQDAQVAMAGVRALSG